MAIASFFVWYAFHPSARLLLDLGVRRLGHADRRIRTRQYFAVDQVDHKICLDRLLADAQFWSRHRRPGQSPAIGDPRWYASQPDPSGSRLFYTQGGIFFTNGERADADSQLSGGSLTDARRSPAATCTILGANDNDIFLYDGTSIVYTPLPNGTGGPPDNADRHQRRYVGHRTGGFAADDTSVYWVANQTAFKPARSQIAPLPSEALPDSRASTWSMDVEASTSQAVYWGAGSPDTGNSGTDGCTVWKLAK